jgi:hypothetical protein
MEMVMAETPKWSNGFQRSDSELNSEGKAARDKHFTSERFVGRKATAKKLAKRKVTRKVR